MQNHEQNQAELARLKRKSKEGLTLLELVVVLTVLVALAGIVLPSLPNLLRQSHVAVCSTNIPELNKAVIMHSTLNIGQHPNNLDNLVDGDGAGDGLPGGSVAAYAGNLAVLTLTADELESLEEIGITDVVIADWDKNPTFGAHTGTPAALDDTTDVFIALDAHVADVMGAPTIAGSRFVVFGVGQQASIVGARAGGIFEAPVHFSDEAGQDPNSVYSRYVLVYRVFDDGEPAEFVGASALHDDGLENVNEHIAEFYL
ncbi:MAG: hypothetical protein JJU05_09135 [Verrucomicrobia bacterium]|nr:hypothetical protein [Verrucomicrobiota bacterium]MCH8527626.1 hypothetical protein [Kiritimatiellia bacterium]